MQDGENNTLMPQIQAKRSDDRLKKNQHKKFPNNPPKNH